MNLDNLNNLIELFSYQSDKQNKKSIFLQWLNPNNKKTYTWEETQKNILKLSRIIKENIKEGDRCLLVSENRPEWFISDMAIMLSGGITVPAYTTYTEEDYKYLIEDCEPSLLIVSNNEMLKKLSNTINEKEFIKKVITLDELNNVIDNLHIKDKEKYLDFNIVRTILKSKYFSLSFICKLSITLLSSSNVITFLINSFSFIVLLNFFNISLLETISKLGSQSSIKYL